MSEEVEGEIVHENEPVKSGQVERPSVSTMPFTSSFQTLQERFEAVLADISGEGSLLRFRDQYERLHETLLESLKNEKRLHEKYQELQLQIQNNADKVQTAIQLSVDDQNTIYLLNEEVKKAWSIVEELHRKDKQSRETIIKLSKEVTELSQLVDQGMGLEKRRRKKELIKLVEEKEKVYQNNLMERKKLNSMKKMYLDLKEKERILKRQKEEAENLRKQAKERGLEQVSLSKREKLNKQKAMKTLTAKERQIDKYNDKLTALQRDLENGQAQLKVKLNDLLKERDQLSEMKNKLMQLKIDNEDLKADIQKRQRQNVGLSLGNKKRQQEMQEKQKYLSSIESELNHALEKREKLMIEIAKAEDKEREVVSQNDRYEGRIFELGEEIQSYENQLQSLHDEIEKIDYLKSKISSKIVTLSNSKESEEDKKQKLEYAVRQLRDALMKQHDYFENQKKRIIDLKKNREKHNKQNNSAHRNLKEQRECNKILNLKNIELTKTVQENRDKLKEEELKYEKVRRERNNFSRQYTDAQEQIYEMRKKYGLLSKQIKHLRSEILKAEKFKEEGIKKKEKTERFIGKLKEEKDKNSEVLRKLQFEIKNVRAEVDKLMESVIESEKQRKEKRKTLKNLMEQRDLLAVQMIRRNDEFALLKEKAKVQEKFLDRGNTMFYARKEDLRILKILIMEGQRSLFVRSMHISRMAGKEEKLDAVLKELKRTRMAVKAIAENLENPVNRNRWRPLGRVGRARVKNRLAEGRNQSDVNNKDEEVAEGEYMSSFEIATKIQSIQKRLIRKSELVVEVELKIDKKKRMILQLRDILKRQPNPRLSQKLNMLQKKIQVLTKQMKAVAVRN